MKNLPFIFLLFSVIVGQAQKHGFPFGKITLPELEMKSYERDTAAAAVVLSEFGEAYFDDNNDNNLLFEYHVRIKILSKKGLDYANVELPLYKGKDKAETIIHIEASAFNLDGTSSKETMLDVKNVFTENRNKFWDLKKFAIPNVRVGTVIEFQYTLESPFIFNFRTWPFQMDIPKIYSEYWATIPSNYKYNISIKGFVPLSKNEAELVRECFTPGGGIRSDCARYRWAMKDIPAFVEEDYMTAKSNFLSTVNFELSEVVHFDGRKDKFTKEWKDVDAELRYDDRFGLQIKRGKDLLEDRVDVLLAGETDPLQRARRIFDFIKNWYQWDETYGFMSEFGLKKALDKKLGNVGDINLSLIAALKFAGLDVEPLILSTRSNGLPIEIHPVLSDFNYVIAKLNINGKVYLLDATDDFLPFGLIPDRCLNGKGRVFGEKESYWYDLKPSDRARHLSMISLQLDQAGVIKGTIQITYSGYDALDERKKIIKKTEKEYIASFNQKLNSLEIKKHVIENLDDLTKPLVVKLEVEIQAYDGLNASHFLFNPFLIDGWKENPFKSSERLFPVDFGPPMEQVMIFNLTYPEEFDVTDLPEKVGVSLPNAGGRYIYNVQKTGNQLTVNSSLQIARTVFTADEYHYLKELFNRVVAIQQGELVFKRK